MGQARLAGLGAISMALKRIVLRDFVIVSELELDLASGFTVLTGETGAGKSILIDALQLVTGARADAGVIREGAGRTDVSAEFESTDALAGWLNAAGFDAVGFNHRDGHANDVPKIGRAHV